MPPITHSRSVVRGPFTRAAVLALVVVVIAAIVGIVVVTSGFDKTQAGEVAVVRNGGPLDNHRIRQVIEPASALTWTGLFSTSHKYPAQQRFYTITSDTGRGDRSGVDVENDATADGVEVGVEGTVYFTLNTDETTLRQFDDKYGTREYLGQDGVMRHAYGNDDGWSSFLDQIVRPVISNDLREQIGDFRCSELQAS